MNYYLHRALFKVGLFKRINVRLTTIINKRRFTIPLINEAGYYNLTASEPWFQGLLQDLFLAKKGAFIDVGMNIGQTLLKVASLDPERHFIGFEPNPLCYLTCRGIIKANHLVNYNIFPCGLSDQTSLLTLYIDKDYSSGGSVLKDFRKDMKRYNQQLNIPVFVGDDIKAIQNESDIAVIKADVEGAELEVINGLKNTISRTHPFVVLEILPVYNVSDENGIYRKKRQDELLAFLHNAAYKLYFIDEKNLQLVLLREIDVHSDMHKTNYLFVHETDTSLINLFSLFSLRK